MQEADYILLDEPFVGIDSVSEEIIMNTLRDLKKLVRRFSSSTTTSARFPTTSIKSCLSIEVIAFGPTKETFTEANLKEAYGNRLFSMEVTYDCRIYRWIAKFHFLQNALITAIVVGVVAGAVGCFIILRGMSLMGDAISHAVLPGVALSFILGLDFFIGAIVFGLLAAIIITYIKGNSIIKSDTAIGITFSSFLALGIILISVAKSSTDLFHILLVISWPLQDTDMFITMGVGAVILLLIWIFFKQLLITSFDELLAKAMGMPVNFYHYLLMVPPDSRVCDSHAKCRNYPDCSLLITPAATAYLYANSLKSMIFLSSTFGATASVLGLFIGYSFNVAAGSSIVLTAASFFLISFFIAPKTTIFETEK